MRYLRHVAVLAGALAGCSLLAAMTATGCSSNGSTTTPSEAGTDGTTDAHPDVQADVATDVQTQDVVGQDVVDAGTNDADAADPISTFLQAQANALCAKLASCCSKELPDASINQTKCSANVYQYGYAGTAIGTGEVIAKGELKFDTTKAASCLSEINAIDCTGNIITTQQQQQIIADCSGAITGNKTAGTSCVASIECATGQFCDTPSDGGAGTCVALSGDGGPCSGFGDTTVNSDLQLSQFACSYRGTGVGSGLRCNNEDLITGAVTPPATWTCLPQSGIDGGCNVNQDCTSLLCDPGEPGYPYPGPDGGISFGPLFQCKSSVPFTYQNNCRALSAL